MSMAESTRREPEVVARLVLVRHAKSDYPWGVTDHDRPLNERGERDAPALGRWLDEHIAWTDEGPLILVSSARRAQQTWSAASAQLSEQWRGLEVRDEPRIYEADVRTLLAVLSDAGAAPSIVLIGHNPGLAELINNLAVEDPRKDEALAKFPTSAVAVLDRAEDSASLGSGSFWVTAFAVPRG